MWASVALMATLQLAPLPVNQLKITNARVTHNPLGWERKDANNPKLYPGDIYILIFDIEGLTPANDSGLVRYGLGFELFDKNGKVVFSKEPEELEATASLGAKVLAASAQSFIGTDTSPGKYTMKVTVTDRKPKPAVSATLSKTFEVVPAQLGLAQIIITYPPAKTGETPLPAPPIAVPGQGYIVNFGPVGFMLDKKNQPDLLAEMRIKDETGAEVLKEPFSGTIKQVGQGFKKFIPMQFILSLNRPGKFTMQIKVTDNIAKKSAEVNLSFVVVESK